MSGVQTDLHLLLLGLPSVDVAGQIAALPPEAPLWLLTFLACQEEPGLRLEVLDLLYPEVEAAAARNRLRNLLHRVRQSEWGAALEASATHLHWTAASDVRAFRQACRSARWEAALRLYRSPLLGGLTPADLPDYAAWLEAEREDLQAAWQDAALHHALDLGRGGQVSAALDWLERVLTLSPYAEEAVQAALRCAVLPPDRSEAARLYRQFQARLHADLGLAPAAETTRLFVVSQQQGAGATSSPRRPGSSPLFGRQDELGWIGDALAHPERRVLTLTGPGGAGKTRLAQEALTLADQGTVAGLALAGQGAQGRAVFVPLEAALTAGEVVSALALALGLTPGGSEPLERQVASLLEATPRLLVLDNLEQLLSSEARPALLELLSGLLAQAPGLRLLLTSRVRTGLQAEWVITLGGLDYPQALHLESAARSGAIRLFVERAAQVRLGFALNAGNLGDLIRLCQLTEALPLALELTATWMGTFGPADLVAELSGSFDALEVDSPDRPERHRSLRAAFEHSWRLLGGEERRVLMGLSVFRGGFERPAALAVSGSGLRPLLTLADHSLLRRDSAGRFSLHEGIRQYAAEHLQRQPEEEARVRQAHAGWYADLALSAQPLLHGPEQTSWLSRLQTEHDNLRLALAWMQAHGDAPGLLRVVNALHWFWYVRGHHREGREWLTRALEQTDARPSGPLGRERAAALSRAGGLARDLGDHPQSQRWLEEALTLARRLEDGKLEAEALHGLALGLRERGELGEARELLERAEGLQRGLDEPWALASTLNDLGIVRAYQNDLEAARPYFQESLTLKERIGDRQGVAYALANLANTLTDSAEYERLTGQSLTIKRELGDRQGVANSLVNLSDLYIERAELGEARVMLSEALDLFWQMGRKRGVASALSEFARLVAAEGDPGTCLKLVGASDALLESVGLPTIKTLGGGFQESARASLGQGADGFYQTGRALLPEQAVGLALQTPEETGRYGFQNASE